MELKNRGKASFVAQLVTNVVIFVTVSAGIIVGCTLLANKYNGFKLILTLLSVICIVVLAYFTMLKAVTVKDKHALGGDEDNLCFIYGYPVIKTFTVPKKNVLSYKITKSGGVYKKRFSNLEVTTSTKKYVFKLFKNEELFKFANEHLKGVDHE